MSLLAFIGIPLIFIGGCLTASGAFGPAGSTFVTGYGAARGSVVHSRAHTSPQRAEGRKKRIKLGLKLCGIGAVLVLIASF